MELLPGCWVPLQRPVLQSSAEPTVCQHRLYRQVHSEAHDGSNRAVDCPYSKRSHKWTEKHENDGRGEAAHIGQLTGLEIDEAHCDFQRPVDPAGLGACDLLVRNDPSMFEWILDIAGLELHDGVAPCSYSVEA